MLEYCLQISRIQTNHSLIVFHLLWQIDDPQVLSLDLDLLSFDKLLLWLDYPWWRFEHKFKVSDPACFIIDYPCLLIDLFLLSLGDRNQLKPFSLSLNIVLQVICFVFKVSDDSEMIVLGRLFLDDIVSPLTSWWLIRVSHVLNPIKRLIDALYPKLMYSLDNDGRIRINNDYRIPHFTVIASLGIIIHCFIAKMIIDDY